MTLVLELPPEIESQVREVAEAEGLDVATFLREAAEARVRQYDPSRPVTESDLLLQINRGFPEAFWDRFRTLSNRSQAGTLTAEEQQELVWHTEQTEARDADRLPYLYQLAALRGVTIQVLMAKLGLHPVSFD